MVRKGQKWSVAVGLVEGTMCPYTVVKEVRRVQVAIKSAGKTLYYAYGRVLMASTTLGGSFMSGGMTLKELKKVGPT